MSDTPLTTEPLLLSDREAPATLPTPLLIGDRALAHLLSIGRSTLWRLIAAGKIPEPTKLGRRRLWHRGEIECWAAAGCPPLREWQAIRATKRLRVAT